MELIEIVLHFDEFLPDIIAFFGPWTYLILFAIIFAETGLVVTPVLPGDSLLFIVGTFSGGGFLNILIAYPILLAAAVLGDSVNYWLGHHLGPRVFNKENSRLFNKAYLERTREFYERHGGKTIILARFIPIIRTFAPFVAGIGRMKYRTFLFYNVLGGFIWVTSLTFAGYFLGGLPIVKNNFEYAVYIIIFVSLIPVFIEFIRHKFFPKPGVHDDKVSYKEVEETFKKEKLT